MSKIVGLSGDQIYPGWPRKNEPPHDNTNKMAYAPSEIQISLGIHPVWSESSLCAQWVAFFMRTAKADQTVRMPR